MRVWLSHLFRNLAARLQPLPDWGRKLHPDFAWIRKLEEGVNVPAQMVCVICGQREDWDANPTYRNQFIRTHSHCGWGDGSRVLPHCIEDRVMNELGERLKRGYESWEPALAWMDTARLGAKPAGYGDH